MTFTLTGDQRTIECREHHLLWPSKKQRRENGDNPNDLENDRCRIFKTIEEAYEMAIALVAKEPELEKMIAIYRVNRYGGRTLDDIDICGVYSLTDTGLHHTDLDG